MPLTIKQLLPDSMSPASAPEQGQRATDDSLFRSGSLAFMDRTPLRLEQLVREISPGDWHSHDPKSFLEAEAMREALSVVKTHWEKAIPEPLKIDLEVSSPMVCADKSGIRCAFLLVCIDPKDKKLWLENDFTPSRTDSDFRIGNLWTMTPEGSGAIRTILTPEALADLIVRAGQGEIAPPEWLHAQLLGSLSIVQREQMGDVPNTKPIEVHELQVDRAGLKGVVSSSIGRHDVIFGIDQSGQPCVRVMGSSLEIGARGTEGNTPNLSAP
jgi:hypothetical protein